MSQRLHLLAFIVIAGALVASPGSNPAPASADPETGPHERSTGERIFPVAVSPVDEDEAAGSFRKSSPGLPANDQPGLTSEQWDIVFAQRTARSSRQGLPPPPPPHHHQEKGAGLGTYGRAGPITREALPSDIRDLVSSRALRMASSADFEDARAGWDLPSDFVRQIDYQLSFRASFDFLSSEPSAIARAMATRHRSEQFEILRLYLTPAESRELERRDRLGDQIDELRQELQVGRVAAGRSTTANLVRLTQDQLDGGRLVAYVLNSQAAGVNEVRQRVGHTNVVVHEVPYSAEQYASFQEILGERLRPLGIDYILGLRRSKTLTVTVEVDRRAVLPHDLLAGLPADAVRIIMRNNFDIGNAGMPIEDHDAVTVTPGTRIITETPRNAFFCTWGFGGHTDWWNYLVTAGHCFGEDVDVPGQWTDEYEAHTAQWGLNLTWRDQYILSEDTDGIDAGRISSGFAGTNCMHWDENDCAWGMEEIAENGSWDEGADRTCASMGSSNKYACNVVESVGEEVNGHQNLVSVLIESARGDSGSGMHSGETIDGILTLEENRWWATDRIYFQTAEDVRAGLRGSFDFNCWDWGLKWADPDVWFDCPVVDR